MVNTHRRGFEAFVSLVLAYEWLVSGLDKVLSGQFVTGLHSTLKGSLSMIPYGFYKSILHAWIIPHAVIFAWLVMVGELLLGLFFSTLAIFYIRGVVPRFVGVLGAVAAFSAAFLNMNFFFFQAGHFFITPSDPFDEGIPVDFLMAVLELGLMISLLVKDVRAIHSGKEVALLRETQSAGTVCIRGTDRTTGRVHITTVSGSTPHSNSGPR